MWLYLKLAWRNVFRNTRRTLIAGIAIGIGLASLVFVDAIVLGMNDSMVHSATASFMGDGQIEREGFRQSLEVEETINGFPAILDNVRQESIVANATPRILSMAMMSSPADVSGITMVGIDPNSEPPLSQIDEAITKGSYFEGDSERDVVIGYELADLLSVDLGDRIVITSAQAHTGDLAQEMFRVSGIFNVGIKDMDKGMAFVRLSKAQDMLNLAGQAHQIAIKFVSTDMGSNTNLPFWKKYSRDGNVAEGWIQMMPELAQALRLSRWSTAIVGIVLFSVVALGIINTLFMSLYERMFEFGVMRAVGTRPFAIGRLIVFEAGALAILSIVLGTVLGLVVTLIFKHTGIDYSGIEYAGVTFRELLYPRMETYQFILFPVCVFLFTMIVGLYPARYAAKMGPAEAMRKSM
jgi:ABC-type lipoprotein release transport system permease subunit